GGAHLGTPFRSARSRRRRSRTRATNSRAKAGRASRASAAVVTVMLVRGLGMLPNRLPALPRETALPPLARPGHAQEYADSLLLLLQRAQARAQLVGSQGCQGVNKVREGVHKLLSSEWTPALSTTVSEVKIAGRGSACTPKKCRGQGWAWSSIAFM